MPDLHKVQSAVPRQSPVCHLPDLHIVQSVCPRATVKLVSGSGLDVFTEEELGSSEVLGQLDRWWEIVTFYTLRLAMAPVIGQSQLTC